MLLKKCVVVALAGLSLASTVTSAAVINFQFTGTVTYGGSLAVAGDQITGSFSYDTPTLPSTSVGGYASYAFGIPFGISANVQGHAVVANNLTVYIQDNFGGNVEDMVDVYGGPVSVDGNLYSNGSFGFRLASKPGNTTVLTSTALPTSFDVAAFDAGSTQNYGWLQSDGAPGGQLLQFSINSIVVPAPVPLPPALVLMMSGMAAMAGIRRRKSARISSPEQK